MASPHQLHYRSYKNSDDRVIPEHPKLGNCDPCNKQDWH